MQYFYSEKKSIPTGTCLILITPDLKNHGDFSVLQEKLMKILCNAVKNSEILFLEGYLKMSLKAFESNCNSNNVCTVEFLYLKIHFLELVKNKLDITFANEQEIMSLINVQKFDEVIKFAKEINKLIVITRGKIGAIAIYGNEIAECSAKKNLKIKDLTGAGDLFAGGFLHGYINNKSLKECLNSGTDMSSKIIQIIGARLS